jgi:hypothetical protein
MKGRAMEPATFTELLASMIKDRDYKILGEFMAIYKLAIKEWEGYATCKDKLKEGDKIWGLEAYLDEIHNETVKQGA